MSDKREVLLVDLSGLLHPAWRVNEHGPVSVTFDATIGGVHRCVSKSPNALVAICLDSRKSWRKDLEPSYKAQREKLPHAFYDCGERVKERLIADGFLLWQVDGMEADDLISTATRRAVEAGHDVIVASTDKDLAALLRTGPPQVRQLKLSTWEFVTEESFTTKSGLRPDQVGDFLALMGDTADGVKGAEGVGPKNAADALKQWDNLTALGAALESDPGACGRKKPTKKGEIGEPYEWTKSILSSWSQIELARKLVDLRYDVPINFDEIYEERTVKPLVKVEEEDPMESDDIPISRGPAAVAKAQEVFNVAAQTNQVTNEVKSEGMPTISVKDLAVYDDTKPNREVVPSEYVKALEPRDPNGARKFAAAMFNSRLFGKFGNEDAILAAAMRGRSLGIDGVTALQCFDVVQNRLAPGARLLIALAQKDSDCEYLYCTEQTPERATYVAKHKKHPKEVSFTYTMEMAKLAGVVKPGTPWVTRPDTMLEKTAGSMLARREFPGATLGLISSEELGGDE